MQADDGKTAVILGAAGGLGQALLTALRRDPEYAHVVGLSRSAAPAGDTAWYQVDATDPQSLNAVAERVGAIHPRVHLFVSCVGVLHDGDPKGGSGPEKALAELKLENLQRSMTINAFAPLAALSAFVPSLRHDEGAVAAVLSAMVGSITDNQLGGWYSYRMSKAALNMGVRNAAIEFGRMRNGPAVVAIHPGTTLTKLSEPFVRRHKNRPPEESADFIMQVISGVMPEDSGKFYNWDGQELPW